ncbi:MAG TPA: squalene/phytoene synthase family protein [Rhodanobacteraceae bacterium]|nr:squalene/phytoene synthase family protein [Rhodanobacteraceae bacterium]
MSGDAIGNWLHAWRGSHPQLESAWPFLRADPRREVYLAFAALEQEWLDVVHAIREPHVAAVKLQWWGEEMQLARTGAARHPLTQAIFADERARAIPARRWDDAMEAAMRALDPVPAADFPAQLAAARSLHGALARIETALWFGADARPERAQAVAAAQHCVELLRNLPDEIEHGRAPLPMALLARHGLGPAEMAGDSDARRGALRDQARMLGQALAESDKMAGPLSLLRGLQARLDRRALRAAGSAADPLQALCRGQGGVRNLLDAWSEAKAWHRAAQP